MSPQANTTRERAVLAKYLVEAHGKEQQLETALQAQIAIAKQADLERSLSDHLQVTREQITALEVQLRRVGQPSSGIPGADAVGTAVTLASTVLNKGLALAKGPLVALRGSSQADRELRIARDCYWNEAEEIAHYRVIEAVAERLGDTATADLARRHRVQEESMQATLERVIGELSGDVLEAETEGGRSTADGTSAGGAASTSPGAATTPPAPAKAKATAKAATANAAAKPATATKPRTAPKPRAATKPRPAGSAKPGAAAEAPSV